MNFFKSGLNCCSKIIANLHFKGRRRRLVAILRISRTVSIYHRLRRYRRQTSSVGWQFKISVVGHLFLRRSKKTRKMSEIYDVLTRPWISISFSVFNVLWCNCENNCGNSAGKKTSINQIPSFIISAIISAVYCVWFSIFLVWLYKIVNFCSITTFPLRCQI